MKPLVTLVLPPLLGALGALAATVVPAYYHAVCNPAFPAVSAIFGG